MMSKIYRVLRGLFAEKKGETWELSKGGVSFWVVLAHVMWVFHGGQTPPIEEMILLYAAMGYNSVKHIRKPQ